MGSRTGGGMPDPTGVADLSAGKARFDLGVPRMRDARPGAKAQRALASFDEVVLRTFDEVQAPR